MTLPASDYRERPGGKSLYRYRGGRRLRFPGLGRQHNTLGRELHTIAQQSSYSWLGKRLVTVHVRRWCAHNREGG